MFTLVLITILASGDVTAVNKGSYSMSECFDRSEAVMAEYIELSNRIDEPNRIKPGVKAFCISTPEAE